MRFELEEVVMNLSEEKNNADDVIIIPSVEEMMEINRRLGGSAVNKGSLDFLLSKIVSKRMDASRKKNIAKIAAIIWTTVIYEHPFVDGNKRTAAESMKLFLGKNGFRLNTSLAGMIYISLKIANNEMIYDNLVGWIYDRLVEG
jgi:death-on-curing protein